MELGRETLVALFLNGSLLLSMRLTIVDRRIRNSRVVAQRLHDVDLAALGPLTVLGFLVGHHPDGGPQTLPLRNLCGDNYFAVHEVCLVLTCYLTGGIVMIATRGGGKGGSIGCLIIFILAALLGFAAAGTFSDLKVWASWCLIMAAVNLFALFKKKSE